jgi:hypothetical protein
MMLRCLTWRTWTAGLIGVMGAVLIGLSSAAPVPGGPAPGGSLSVPAEYADLYAALEARIKAADAYLGQRWTGERHAVTFSAELLAANGNQGETLLREQQRQAVTVYLDRLVYAGARGVKVAIKYPLLVQDFPRSAEYVEFFRWVGSEIRRRNLKMLAQMTPTFRDPTFSQVPIAPYYAGLTWERYKREKRQHLETLIREIRPDYITIENEPGTASANTGLRFTPETMADVLTAVLSGLDKQGVLLGAGTGTWDELSYLQALARIPGLDYLDIHIYPINRDFLVDRAFRMGEIARRANKRPVLGEAWLYKARDSDLGGAPVAAAPALFARDVYGFWEPLDVQFIETMGRLSHHLKIDFTSFFWSRHFYGYTDYSAATRRLPPAELFRLANQAAVQNMMADPPRLTRTGETFQRMSRSGP